MAALPGSDWSDLSPSVTEALGTVSHLFTHFSLDLTIVRHRDPIAEGWWQPVSTLASAGLPKLYRRAADLALAASEAPRAAA